MNETHTRSLTRWLVVVLAVLMGHGAAEAQSEPFDARDDRAACARDGSVAIDVLANDLFTPGLTEVRDVTDPEHGELIQGQLPGQFIFIPDKGFLGTTSFRYTLVQVQPLQSDSATVTIRVLDAANLAGSFEFAEQVCSEGGPCELQAEVSIFNQGTRCACPVAVQVLLSDDDQLDAADRTMFRFMTPAIDPDHAFDQPLRKRLKQRASVTGKFLFLKIDVTDRLFELNERDNTADTIVGPLRAGCPAGFDSVLPAPRPGSPRSEQLQCVRRIAVESK
jgi:hypothetical protein